jgi:hypothetical protein
MTEPATEHPYITRVPGKRGGRPIIRGTGITLDHQDEIEREIRESRMEYLTEQHDLTVGERGFVHFPEQGES